MDGIPFDTLKINNRLRSEGFTEQQAAITIEKVADAVTHDLSRYPTRFDMNAAIAELK